MRKFASLIKTIDSTNKTNLKVEALSNYFLKNKIVTNPDDAKNSLFLHPIIKYYFNTNELYFSPYGSSTFDYEIGERVELYNISKSAEYIRLKDSKISKVFYFFFVIGACLIAAFFLINKKLGFIDYIPLVMISVFFLMIYFKIKKAISKTTEKIPSFVDSILKQKIMTSSQVNNLSNIYFTQSELSKIIQKNNKIQFYVSLVFFTICLSGFYFCWKSLGINLQKEVIESVNLTLKDFSNVYELKKYINRPKVILSGVSLVFSILLSISTYYSWKKIR